MRTINANINTSFTGSSSRNWTPQYWVQQSECYEIWKVTGAGNLVGLKRWDILTVGGSIGSYTFQVPNTNPYQTYDTDKIWFKSDLVQRTVTQAEIVGFDFSKTIVKFLSTSPFTPDYIMILSSAFATANENKMRDEFLLSNWWNDTNSEHGEVKDNRGTGQSVFIPEPNPPSTLVLGTPTATTIPLTWDDSSGTIHILRSTTDESSYSEVHSMASGIKAWTDTAVIGGTKYYYKLYASNTTGNSSYSASVNTTTLATKIVYDTFTGTDGAYLYAHTKEIGGAWTDDSNVAGSGIFKILSNQANFLRVSDASQFIHCESGESDQDISLDITMPNSANYSIGIAFRFQDKTHCWEAAISRVSSGTPYVACSAVGGGASLGTPSITQENGVTHTLRVVAKGNAITVYWNGTQVLTGSNTYLNNQTKVGLYAYVSTAYVWSLCDNFIVYKAV
jgi:hypothetical protein